MSKLSQEKQAAIRHGRRLLNREFPDDRDWENIQKLFDVGKEVSECIESNHNEPEVDAIQ